MEPVEVSPLEETLNLKTVGLEESQNQVVDVSEKTESTDKEDHKSILELGKIFIHLFILN